MTEEADPKPWMKALAELDFEIAATFDTAVHTVWASAAVALTLLDEGLIEKAKLLRIMETIIGLVSAEYAEEPDEAEDMLRPLLILRDFLEGLPLRPGTVEEELRLAEVLAIRAAKARRARRASIPD